jgi:hypothetical protein
MKLQQSDVLFTGSTPTDIVTKYCVSSYMARLLTTTNSIHITITMVTVLCAARTLPKDAMFGTTDEVNASR